VECHRVAVYKLHEDVARALSKVVIREAVVHLRRPHSRTFSRVPEERSTTAVQSSECIRAYNSKPTKPVGAPQLPVSEPIQIGLSRS
jgi:hypothetical protein